MPTVMKMEALIATNWRRGNEEGPFNTRFSRIHPILILFRSTVYRATHLLAEKLMLTLNAAEMWSQRKLVREQMGHLVLIIR